VPQVDFMTVCDYVRVEGGLFHIIAAGVDRIRVPALPTVQNVGVAVRLALTRAECEHQHELRLIFQDSDGRRIIEHHAQHRVRR
jgi:hypothetical protein